jgi:topoisomerase-4 subunit A
MEVNLEEFIAIKGINALGNQLTREKINQISLLDPLPYEAPEEVHADELEVVDEETVSSSEKPESKDSNGSINPDKDPEVDGSGQATLF